MLIPLHKVLVLEGALMEKIEPKHKYVNVIYYVASFLVPNIFLFELYNRNHAETNINFIHVLALAGVLAVGGMLSFLVFRLIIKSIEGALLLTLFAWLTFWLYELLLSIVRSFFSSLFVPSRVFALLLLIVIGLVAIIFRRYKPPFFKIRPVFNVLALCLIVLFVFNSFPAINREVTFIRARNELTRQVDEGTEFYIKRDFNVNPGLPNPDIYWFHMDGMMSLGTVERFWGMCFDDLREELGQRGFLIYEDVQLNAGNTNTAWAALLSPAFYDSFWGEQLDNTTELIRTSRVAELDRELARIGITNREDIAPYYELFGAFVAANYKFDITAGTVWTHMPTSFDHLISDYRPVLSHWHDFQRGGLAELLTMTTPLNVPYLSEDTPRRVRGIWYQSEPVAQFVWRPFLYTHMWSVLNHYSIPEEERDDSTRYDLYPPALERAIEAMIYAIDEILEINPDAVIILQSDHGIHRPATQRHLLEQGYSFEQVKELSHSVFSAVRIPERYGGLDEPTAPLNITRVLVNRFVGENYELLPSGSGD